MPSEDLIVRRAALDDAPALAAVQVASWNATYRGLMPDSFLDGFTVEKRTTVFERFLDPRAAHPVPRIWVAGRPSVVGFASVGASRDEPTCGELYAIYVEPSAMGRGAGRALLDAALEDLRQLGFDEVTLWVHVRNERARHFYEAAGLRTDGGEKDEIVGGAPVPHVRYRAALAGL